MHISPGKPGVVCPGEEAISPKVMVALGSACAWHPSIPTVGRIRQGHTVMTSDQMPALQKKKLLSPGKIIKDLYGISKVGRTSPKLYLFSR